MTFTLIPIDRATKKPAVKWKHLRAGESVAVDPARQDHGCLTGARSGVVVVDLDTHGGKDGLGALAARLGGMAQIPATLTVRTRSGGLHLYFAHPGRHVPNSQGRIAEGVDVRGDGGYAKCPPSPGYEIVHLVRPIPCPDWLLAVCVDPSEPDAPPIGSHAATQEDLRDLERRWARTTKRASALAALKALIRGETIAAPGQRDSAVFRLVSRIVKDAPHFSDESLADLFRPSLMAMGAEQGYRDKVEDMARRCHTQPGPPAHERIASERWIVQTPRAEIFYRVGDTYRGPELRETMPEILRQLYPREIEAGRIKLEDLEGRPLGPSQWINRYGESVREVRYEIGRTEPDEVNGDHLILGCANREVPPAYSRQVDAFLRALSPNEKTYLDLMTWIYVARAMPKEPLPCLVLIGPKGIGKSTLAIALAKMWDERQPPTSCEDAFAQFNEGLRTQPLIFADEAWPKLPEGRSLSALIRKQITQRTISIGEKFRSKTTIDGCVRMIFVANDADRFSWGEAFGHHEIEPIAQRFYWIDAPDSALEHVNRLDIPTVISEFAGHAAWIVANMPVPQREGKRLWIEGDMPAMMRRISMRGGPREAVLEWIVFWLLDPQALQSFVTSPLSRIGPFGEVLISVRDLVRGWDAYLSRNRMSVTLAGRALAGITTHIRRVGTQDRVRLSEVDRTILTEYAIQSGHATEQEIADAIALAQGVHVPRRAPLSLVRTLAENAHLPDPNVAVPRIA